MALTLFEHPQTQRQPGVDARRFLADHAGAQHQPVGDDLRLFRGFAEDGQEDSGSNAWNAFRSSGCRNRRLEYDSLLHTIQAAWQKTSCHRPKGCGDAALIPKINTACAKNCIIGLLKKDDIQLTLPYKRESLTPPEPSKVRGDGPSFGRNKILARHAGDGVRSQG